MEHEHEHFTDEQRRLAKRITFFAIAFSIAWITFLVSCVVQKKSPDYYYNYGKHFVSEGDYVKAQIYFTRAIKENPSYFEAYYERALIWEKDDSIKNAIKDYDTLLAFKNLTVSKTAELYFQRANMHYLLSEDTLACRDWKKSCDFNFGRACDMVRKRCK